MNTRSTLILAATLLSIHAPALAGVAPGPAGGHTNPDIRAQAETQQTRWEHALSDLAEALGWSSQTVAMVGAIFDLRQTQASAADPSTMDPGSLGLCDFDVLLEPEESSTPGGNCRPPKLNSLAWDEVVAQLASVVETWIAYERQLDEARRAPAPTTASARSGTERPIVTNGTPPGGNCTPPGIKVVGATIPDATSRTCDSEVK